MFGRIKNTFLIGILSGQLIVSGCVHTPTIQKPGFAPFVQGQPVSEQALTTIKSESQKDAVFADLLQAFALMRTRDLTQNQNQQEILGLLETSVSSFEDMNDPVNFSQAFSADESKAFRGRAHERMMASTMAGVFLMARNQCAQALPYLRNAEFLDARFQKLPFGTDAPLIYALMYRCLKEQNANNHDVERAKQGVFRSVRFLTMQEVLIEALVDVVVTDLRPMALNTRLASMLFEISIYHSLMTAPDNADPDALIDDAAKNTSIFISALNTHFDDEYKAKLHPLMNELASVYGLNKKDGLKHLEELTFDQVSKEAMVIGAKLKNMVQKNGELRKKVALRKSQTDTLTASILRAASADKTLLTFSGLGPTLLREGSYQEISVVKPSKDANPHATIRERDLKLSTACGFHRTAQGGFSVVLCQPGTTMGGAVSVMPNLELLSLSRKATTAQGRKFDKVLKGRAQFRAATEKVAEISAWSAFFLFYLGAEMINDCNRRREGEACYSKAWALWGIASVTILFSGTVWLIGRASHPAADSRFIHLMYESAWMAI